MSDSQAPNIVTLLRRAVEAAPADPFITDVRTRQTWTYEDIWYGALSLAGLLTQQGVSTGDRVALLTKNHPVFFPLLFACAIKGAMLVPLNKENLPEEIHTILSDAQVSLVLHDEPASAAGRIGLPVTWPSDGGRTPARPPLTDGANEVLIIYTSGTTGHAKGVVLTHRNLVSMANTFVSFYTLRPRQRFLSMLPFYHINAPMITGLVCIAARAHVFLTDPYGWSNARAIFDMVEEHRIQVLSLTPSIMASLLQLNPHGTRRNTSSLEFCFCGTAALGEKLWRQFEHLFHVPVYQGYGLTETTTWATMTPPDARKRYDSVGLPVGCEIRIEGDTTGEVLIRGDIVMRGYYHRNKLTRQSLQHGWYRTGDVGYLDRDGQLIIVGRTKHIIKRRGVLIHPEAIDACLRQCDHVVDACTVGVPDDLVGEKVVTACVLSGGTLEEVRADLHRRLSPYMRPDAMYQMPAIPRNDVGKALAARVRDLVSGVVTERFIRTFDRYQVRRANSAHMPAIRQMIHESIIAGTPIRFAGFWGVGERRDLAAPDHRAISRLGRLLKAMNAVLEQSQASMLLILADVHARCNRFPEGHIAHYLQRVAALAAAHGLDTIPLSQLWAHAGLSATDVETGVSDPEVLRAWQHFPLREEFLEQAEKRCGSHEQAEAYALRYYCTCLTERRMLTAALKGAILFTYNAPKFSVILPDLPIVYWHSIKPGTAAKPWFM
jgi:acyl-CoA synthetase (AMP-forming)/AMP-acid ligase II